MGTTMLTGHELWQLQDAVRARTAFRFSNFEKWGETTLEHMYQAAKTTDLEERDWIMASPTPGEAKRRGRQIKHLRKGWDEKKIGFMSRLIAGKFGKDTPFALRLTMSQGELVEWNTWHDQFWGKCVCDKHQGQGENWLGILLMIRRSQLWARM